MRFVFLFSFVCLFVMSPAVKADEPPEWVTVYVDADLGARKAGGARRITASHAEWAEKGYRPIDMEIYIEDEDMEGFFITYERIKTPSCP